MGAYPIGAVQALSEHAFEPDWVCGISLAAINGAVIAGNAPAHMGRAVCYKEGRAYGGGLAAPDISMKVSTP